MRVLGEIFDRYQTDKGSTHDAHRYHNLYEILFAPLQHRPVRLLELGVGTGASIQAWLTYFDDVTVDAVDTNLGHCRSANLGERVRLHEGRSEDPTLVDEREFDIIIDDANHDRANQLANIRIYWPKLNLGGYYIIEDLFVGVDDASHLPWGGEASPSSNSLVPTYDGYGNPPDRDFLPRHPQDLYLVSRRGLPADVSEILDTSNHFFAITNVSPRGGLHVMLVVQKAAATSVPRPAFDHAHPIRKEQLPPSPRRGTLKQIGFRTLSRIPMFLRLWRRLKPDGGPHS